MRRSTSSSEPSARDNFTPTPRGAAPSPGPEPTTAAPGGRLSPRNWRVPTRLNAILLIPVLVGLIMGGFQVKSSIDTWQEAEDAKSTALLVAAALSYSDTLLIERDVSAAPLLQGKGTKDPTVTKARSETDKAADAFDQAARGMPARPGLQRRLERFREVEQELGDLRAAAYTDRLSGVRTEKGYLAIEHRLQEFANELGLGTANITSYGRAVYAIALAKGALSLERSIGMHMLIKPGPEPTDLARQRVALSSYAYLEGVALEEYTSGGTEADSRKLAEATETIKSDAAEMSRSAGQRDPDYVPPPADPAKMVEALSQLRSTGTGERAALAGKGITPENWWAVNTLKYDSYRALENDLADTAVNEASAIADDARQDALITGSAVVIALLAAFILAGMVARQMSRSMRRLRNAAFGIAEQRLPMLVDQLSRTDPGRVETRVAPIPITSHDEIGEVARAFDQVHREAVRLAAEQALLRGNINAIFTNLSRRNQSLIEGQLTLITDLENNEADPDQLENLFRLDHLATRMRRNGENLLVLAGEEPGRRWDQPVPLVDVLRAAASEVEQYERVELSGVPEAEIHGRAVTDLVHLLAELLENATTFSSPQTKVKVTATRLPDGRVMIEIHDKGIGLTAEDFADINHKLANPPTVDASISQRMGLFVVGRLSDRHGIRVQLRPSGEQAGTTSLVMLPDALTHGGGGGQRPAQNDFTVSQIIPEHHAPGHHSERQPLRTAAELGFDDSRYNDVPDDLRDLDPVGRSLLREERRAALEADIHAPGPDDPQTPVHAADLPATAPAYDADPDLFGERHAEHGGRPAYEEHPTTGYDETSTTSYGEQLTGYEDAYYTPGGGRSHDDTFSSVGYLDEPVAARPSAGEPYPAFEQQHRQEEWSPQDYRNGTSDQYSPQAESAQAGDVSDRNGVGFDRPAGAFASGHSLTDAGLPRRGVPADGNRGAESAPQEAPTPTPVAQSDSDDAWRSQNDERWQQASQLRKPKAGGVTSSGLPRRVPKANLVQGAAEATPQGGPQVSRAPEDIRGRLSNLRRGVQQGRSAGSETNGQVTGNQNGGPDSTYHQER